MNQQEFGTSMQRILSFHAAPRSDEDKRDLANYMSALFEAVSRMDSFTFDRVTKDLSNNMARGQKPMPGQFWAIFHKIRGEAAQEPVDACQTCKTTGWVEIPMYHAADGLSDRFATPCPDCRAKHPLANAPRVKGWTDVESVAPEIEETTPATIRFMRSAFEADINWEDHPDLVMAAFLKARSEGKVKCEKKKRNIWAAALEGIKVVKAPEREQTALSPVVNGSSEPDFVDWEAEA